MVQMIMLVIQKVLMKDYEKVLMSSLVIAKAVLKDCERVQAMV